MAASYVGIHTQIKRNNTRSILLLLGFPLLVLAVVWAIFFLLSYSSETPDVDAVNAMFLQVIPWVIGGVAIWFLIAWFAHTGMIKAASGARPLERRDNMRVYNLVENLCISRGMKMPKVQIIESDALNAFASGINEKSYTVTLTRGIINKLDDAELEGVIAHELMHIQNRDVRLLIISVIFVGIFAFVAQLLFRNMIYGSMIGGRRRNRDGRAMLIVLVVVAVAWLLSILIRFAISRKREYMADSGAADMTRNPRALASALRKISGNYDVESVKNGGVRQMLIHYEEPRSGLASSFGGLFTTHPPVEKRIEILEGF